MRYKNLEFLQIDGRDPEIVAISPHVITIMWWKRGKEGWHIEFVGSRPLEQDMKDVWNLMIFGQAFLDAQFRLEEA